MKRPVRIRVADPAGNITIFVLDHFDRADYADAASALLGIEEIGAEQVAFVTGERSMEMCGLEFCGNASRSFALICAEKIAGDGKNAGDGKIAGDGANGYIGQERHTGQEDLKRTEDGMMIIPVSVSGADGEIDIAADPETGYTRIAMPVPHGISIRGDLGGTLVDLGGIVHLVLEDEEASDSSFSSLKKKIMEELDPPAFGVMYCRGNEMTPVVYVKDVDSTYYEGSCASGMTAVMASRSCGREDGAYSFEMTQPCGKLSGTVTVSDGRFEKITIEGPVMLSEEMTVMI